MGWHRFRGPARAGALAAVVVTAVTAEGSGSPQLVAAGAVVAWWSIIVVLAAGWLRRRPSASIPGMAIIAGSCLVGIAALSFLSLVWASDAGRAFSVAVQGALYAGLFVLVVLISSPGDGRLWLGGLALGLATVCAIALGSRLIPGIEPDAALYEALPAAQGRLSFPVGYWNALGALAALAVIVLTWLGARGGGRLERALATAAIPLACLVLYFTFSRGAIAAAAVGIVALVALGPARPTIVGTAVIGIGAGGALAILAATRPDLRNDLPTGAADSQGVEVLVATVVMLVLVGIVRYAFDASLATVRVPRIAGAAVLGLVALALVAGAAAADPGGWVEEFKQPPEGRTESPEFGPTQRLGRVSGQGRWQFWETAVEAFREEPVTGLGAGGFEAFWNQHGTLREAAQHAHSIFLDYLVELGPLGLLLITGAFGAGVACAAGRRSAMPGGEAAVAVALLLAAMLAFAIDWSWSIPGVALPAIVVLAVATGPATIPRLGSAPAGGRSPRGRPRVGLSAVTILLAWGAIWAGGLSLLTEVKISQSQAAATRGDLADAASHAGDAVTLQPWAASPRLQLGLVHELAGDLASARQRVLEAADRAPDDWAVWLVLSRVERSLGNGEAAREAGDRADMLLPD